VVLGTGHVAYIFRKKSDGSFGTGERLDYSETESNDTFGVSLAIDEESLVVGAPIAEESMGAIYVFLRQPDGAFDLGKKVVLGGYFDEWDAFGCAVASDGDVFFVGALGRDEDRGAAYLLHRDAAGQFEIGPMLAPSEALPPSVQHGRFLAASQNTLVAVVPWHGIFVYQKDTRGQYAPGVRLIVEGKTDFSDISYAHPAVSDDTIAVGAAEADEGEGAVYYFSKRADGTFGSGKKLKPKVLAPGDSFGSAVSLSGKTLAVSASGRGSVFLFQQQGDGSFELLETVSPQEEDVLEFGYTVALLDDTLIVGAPFDEDSLGTVYVFSKTPDARYEEKSRLRLDQSNTEHADFGISLALSRQALVIGAAGVAGREGAAYVFRRIGDGLYSKPLRLFIDESLDTVNRLGVAVAIEGEHILVGSYLNQVYIY
jgi:hypothetical protein